MITNDSLIDRYKNKMRLVPVVNGYPSQQNGFPFTYYYGEFQKQGFEKCKVLLEFDPNNPAQGIYLGCQLGCNTDNTPVIEAWEPIVDKIKRDFTLFWRSASTVKNRFLEWDFKDEDCHRYWPFWIRLEENEDIFEAVKFIEIIICSLKAQGFK